MRDIAIYGAGGFGKEVASLINQINHINLKWRLIGFFDDGVKKGTKISHFGEVLGGMEQLNDWKTPLDIAIAIGNPHSLRKVRERITNHGVLFPNVIAPDFGVSDNRSFSIGEGNIIGYGCAVSVDVRIGNYNILNADVVMGHDSEIGNFNVLMPDIRVSGEVIIGENNLIGVGSIILQRINVGNSVHIGAGAVLMTRPKDNSTYIGNPAKLFKI